MEKYHIAVLLQESVDALRVVPEGRYVDATFGGGGHTREILNRLGPAGLLMAFDQDEDARSNLPEDDRLIFAAANFKYIQRFMRYHEWPYADGVLADLGVSSHQLNQAERGFAFRFEGPLDMRMNKTGPLKASDILNTYGEKALQQVFGMYGEVRNARTLAQKVVSARQRRSFSAIGDLLAVIEPYIRGNRQRYLAQVFQALRIEVNDEMGALREFLEVLPQVVRPGARVVILSYHSIEDRLVKNFLRDGNFLGEPEKDFYGNIIRPFKQVIKKALVPGEEEISRNPRARSARMRVAERT